MLGWLLILFVSQFMFEDDGLAGLFKAFFRIGSIIYGGGQASFAFRGKFLYEGAPKASRA